MEKFIPTTNPLLRALLISSLFTVAVTNLNASQESCLASPISNAALDIVSQHVPESNQAIALAKLVTEQLGPKIEEEHIKTYFDEMLVSAMQAAIDQSSENMSLKITVEARIPLLCALVIATSSKSPRSDVNLHSGDKKSLPQSILETDTVKDVLVKKLIEATGQEVKTTANTNNNEKLKNYQSAVKQAHERLQKIEYSHSKLLALSEFDKEPRPFFCRNWSTREECTLYFDKSRADRTEGLAMTLESVLDEFPDLYCQDLLLSTRSGKEILPCSHFLSRLMRNQYAIIEQATTAATLLSANSVETQLIQQLKNEATPRYANVVSLEARRNANYGLFAGPSIVLKQDGSWDAGTAITARFETEAFPPNFFICPSRMKWCRGSAEISFLTPGTEFPTEVENQEDLPVNPFDSTGRLQARFNYRMHFNDWAGIEFGVGFTSPINDAFDFNRIEPRVQLGTYFQTVYADSMLGSVSMGIAHDRFREVVLTPDNPDTMDVDETIFGDEYNRLYVDATMLFPNLRLGGWRLSTSLNADWPIDGNQEADLRVNILFYYPFNDWLDGFKPKIGAKTP